jgi:hypothetical protein
MNWTKIVIFDRSKVDIQNYLLRIHYFNALNNLNTVNFFTMKPLQI